MRKAEIYELRETIKAMERKVEIARGKRKNLLSQRHSPTVEAEQSSRPARWKLDSRDVPKQDLGSFNLSILRTC
jgi:hypothetical protein